VSRIIVAVQVSDEKHDMIQNLALTESKINEVINQKIIKMIGLATYISTNTDIDAEEFDYFIGEIVDIDNSIINNITIFEDTTAVYFYPYELHCYEKVGHIVPPQG